MSKTTCAAVMILAAVGLAGCGKCTPTRPTATATTFSGTVAGGGVVFHDLSVASGTDSVDAAVQWTGSADLRLIQIDPGCDPTRDSCQRWSDPQRPRPGTTQSIQGYLNHQGSHATGRVRLMIENLTPDTPAAYTITLTPKKHGSDC